jgi:alkanesulfonate monooxygenase SsuD/methylene tetrahydromethanopterin reductase-like flavin-dependent oxidoreductase (luciferase family)
MRQGFALFAGLAPEIIRASAREAEGLGYTSFWVNHPGATDGVASLAEAARETRRIVLGVGVIPLHTRGPSSIAQGVRTHGLPFDRTLVGVGSAGGAALQRLRDGVAALRSALPEARLVAAALGPRMCRLGGEIADGVLFNWLTPEHARQSAEWVRAGAAAAGRKAPTLFAYVRVAVGAAARDRLGTEAARYAAYPAYAAHFTRMKVNPVETAIAVQSPDALRPALSKWKDAVDEVVLRAITGKDTVDDVLALLRAAKP